MMRSRPCYDLTSVTIGNSVTNIGDYAFDGCIALTSMTIPNSVTSIGDQALMSCISLTSLTFGNAATSIGDGAFYECYGLTGVTIGNSVTSIGTNAFCYCSSLTSVTIGNSVTNIGEGAFLGCSALTSITVNAANPSYATAGGVLFNKTLTALIECPEGRAGSYAIPNGVTNIGNYAFYDCNGLTSVTFPNSVTSIGYQAFYGCSGLTSVTLPQGVTTIANNAFTGCNGLTNMTLGNAVTSIGFAAFSGCSHLTTVTIPDSVTNIGDYAFAGCSMRSLTIPNSVISIGNFYGYAFANCTSLHTAYFKGNAPSVNFGPGSADGTTFNGEAGTVYYVPGTSGWGATFGGWPTAGWYQPQPQILGAGYGLDAQSNRFGFTISWATNVSVVVQAATNLANPVWTPLATNALAGGTNYFSDPAWTNYPSRFYRILSQ